MKKSDITPEICRQLIGYDPETGILTWLPRDREWFKNDHDQRVWNAQNALRPALDVRTPDGYRAGTLLGRTFAAHRVAWAVSTGFWPVDILDHINGDRSDNRIANLRPANTALNVKNRQCPRNNKSGVTGVHWKEKDRRWIAQISVDRRQITIGQFACFNTAVAARLAAEVQHGFHPNHGRAAFADRLAVLKETER